MTLATRPLGTSGIQITTVGSAPGPSEAAADIGAPFTPAARTDHN